MSTIDAHQHFWRYDQADYGWIEPDGPLARDRLPDALRAAMDGSGIAACIAVQARQSDGETDWLLSLAAEHSWIAGVIGWADLTAVDLEDRLDYWAGTWLVGLRHVVQDEPDPRFLLRDAVIAGVRAVLGRGLAYDILVRSPQWPVLDSFLDRVGPGTLVLDHGGKPDIAGGAWRDWADMIRRVARHPHVLCKVSGLVTEADHRDWTADGIAPYLDHLLAHFGPERLIFGSDWPVCLLAADYARVVGLVEDFVVRACPDHHDAIFGGTAKQAYRLKDRG